MGFKLEQKNSGSKDVSESRGGLEKFLKTEISLFSNGFGNKKKQAFYQELYVLLNAGIPLRTGLELIVRSQTKQTDRELLGKVLEEIVKGKPFSDALAVSGKFSNYEIFSLRIGEETGMTAKVAQELANFYQRKNEQRSVVVSALTYPAIVMTTSVLVVIFMLTYVVPMFQDIFRQNNVELPMLTRMIVKTSTLLTHYWYYLLICAIAVILGIKMALKYKAVRSVGHHLLLRIPIGGTFAKKVYLAQFTQALALLTSARVPLLNSMRLVSEIIKFIPLQNAIKTIESGILQGKSLSEGMRTSAFFDERLISLVKVSEETNETEYIFQQINEQYNLEVSRQSKTLSIVIEPVMILMVGIIVGVLLVAMYLPMFQLSSAIG